VSPDTELILSELRELRAEVIEALQRIAALEADNRAVMGNGQPGRLIKAEEAIQAIKQRIWWCLGAAAGVSGVMTAVAWIIKG
jgi:hypothetical protein